MSCAFYHGGVELGSSRYTAGVTAQAVSRVFLSLSSMLLFVIV